MSRLTLLVSFVFLAFSMSAQDWQKVENRGNLPEHLDNVGNVYEVNISVVTDILSNTPKRAKTDLSLKGKGSTIDVPIPDGTVSTYKIFETNIFGEGTLSQYPELGSYTGYNVDNKLEVIKITKGYNGVSFMIKGTRQVFIDPIEKENSELYHVYWEEDYRKTQEKKTWSCNAEHHIADHIQSQAQRFNDGKLRIFRLALSCTGEYAQFHGGTIPTVLDAYNVAMTRVNGVYERELSVTMVLIDSVEKLINLDANTDPFTNNNGSAMLGENDSFINSVFSSDLYDIGHVFSTGGGGIASLQSVCTSRKTRGVTGQANPINDPFTIDYVAHEMGHQFGANHTQNNNCNRVSSTAMEPGSASTIMGYAGICSPNVQNRSDDYFHAVSLIEMNSFLQAIDGCPETIDHGNTKPVITNTVNYYAIPANTPFVLDAEATDMEEDSLTYCWEQMDPQVADMPPAADNVSGPSFRSLNPTQNSERYFPPLRNVLDGTKVAWEVLSTAERSYNFNLTVRDNNLGAGNTANFELEVDALKGEEDFIVTFPDDDTTVPEGAFRNVTWNVAGTDLSPINTTHVDIYVSTDSGNNFEKVAENVPNTGTATIEYPKVKTLFGKVMVKSVDNIFYNVNDGFFTIDGTFDFGINSDFNICNQDTVVLDLNVNTYGSFSDSMTVELVGLPEGISSEISQTVFDTAATFQVTLRNLSSIGYGDFNFDIVGTNGEEVVTEDITINNQNDTIPVISIIEPLNESININTDVTASWGADIETYEFELELDTSPGFSNPIVSIQTQDSSVDFKSLDNNTVYYWRVKPISFCYDADWGPTHSFRTKILVCDVQENNTEIEIPTQEGTITSVITTSDAIDMSDLLVNVVVEHSYTGDIGLVLMAPSGEEIEMLEQIGDNSGSFGCSGSDFDLTFSDNAQNSYEELANSCESPMTGTFRPKELFASIEIENTIGDWTLEVTDRENQDGGALLSWSMSNCTDEITENISLTTNALVFTDSIAKPFTASNINVDSDNPESINYTVKSLPEFGALHLNDEDVEVGTIFTQSDINNNLLTYSPHLLYTEITEDNFLFDVSNQYFDVLFNQSADIILGETNITLLLVEKNDPTCYQAEDGSIEVNAIAGEGLYSFRINGGDYQDSGIFTDLPEGDYMIEVKDELEEVASLQVTLSSPDELILAIGVTDNSIDISAEGGTSPYLFSIDNGEFTDVTQFTLENLTDYSIKVRDANGCEDEVMISINYIEAINFEAQNISCFGETDGSFTLMEIIGGEAPYDTTVSLDDIIIDDYTALTAGSYLISVIDANGYEYISTFEIIEPEALTIEVATDISTIAVTVTGGTPPYQYSIDNENFQAENEFDVDLSSDVDVFVKDSNDCEISTVITDVNDLEILDISVSPNPSHSKFYLEGISTLSNLSYQVHNTNGQLIRSGIVNKATIDLSGESSGIYILKLTSGGSVANYKLIKVD